MASEITFNVAGKGYSIKSEIILTANHSQLQNSTAIYVEKDGKPTKYSIQKHSSPSKTVQETLSEGVNQTTVAKDFQWLSIFGKISPIESEALSVIRNLYREEKSIAKRKSLEMIYNIVLRDAKYGFIMDASTKGIPDINE